MKPFDPRSFRKFRGGRRAGGVGWNARLLGLALLSAGGGLACSEEPVESGPTNVLAALPAGGSTCGAVEREYTLAKPEHVGNCTPINYGSNPPSSGTHYVSWAAYRTYDTPIERGFAVHSMEHGAVVISYNCADCEADVEAAKTLITELDLDPLCCSPPAACAAPVSRLILMPDPELDVRFAAASWGFTLKASCFEPEVFRAFVLAHRGRGPEAVCADGVDVSVPPC
jgi:hypothetical protein